MIDEKHSGSTVRLTAQVTRMLAVLGALVFLAGCAPQAGTDTDTGTDTSQGEEETADDETDSGDDNSSGGNGIVDLCALVPDAALEAALGSPPGQRDLYRGTETTCAIYGTGAESSLVTLTYVALGRDAFEVHRSYVEGTADLYFEVPGLGEDAFRFGNDVTALQGRHIIEAYLEGLAFDYVPDNERLARTIALLQAAIANLPE